MSIKQLNATYHLNEDRILFRFNTQEQAEYRLWFTRRVTLFILAASAHLLTKKLEQVHSPDTAKAVNEFEKIALIEAMKTANAGSSDYESGVQFPLGFDPLLVMDASCSLAKNGEENTEKKSSQALHIDDALSVDFLLSGGAHLNLNLPNNLMRAMCLLLDQLREHAGWGEAILSIKKDDAIEPVLEGELKQNHPLH